MLLLLCVLVGTLNYGLVGALNYALGNALAQIERPDKYLLYTSYNPNSPQYILSHDFSTIRSSFFDPQAPTVVLIHGWLGTPNQEFDISVINALLQPVPNQTLQNVNIIVVDWRRVSSLPYAIAANRAPHVGNEVGHFLTYLNGTIGAPFTSMHLVGYALGAHVAANAGKHTGGKVRRITGLDPAGPGWYLNSLRLKPGDAMYVEAIHTNGFGLGIGLELVADANFYVNGGSLQPGCANAICNHARSHQLFAASLRYNHLVGRKCTDKLQMIFNICRGDPLPMGNNDLNKYGNGVYRINTNAVYPYM